MSQDTACMSSDLVRGLERARILSEGSYGTVGIDLCQVLHWAADGDYALYESMRKLAFKVSDFLPLSETLDLALAETERREEK